MDIECALTIGDLAKHNNSSVGGHCHRAKNHKATQGLHRSPINSIDCASPNFRGAELRDVFFIAGHLAMQTGRYLGLNRRGGRGFDVESGEMMRAIVMNGEFLSV